MLKSYIFKYFIQTDFNKLLFNDIFNSMHYKKLIKYILKSNIITNNNKQLEFINFNSARMTLFELE